MRLDPENLNVSTFETESMRLPGGGGYCCTGCDSGCGINPTAGGCDSGGVSFDKWACGAQEQEFQKADQFEKA